MLLRLLFIAIAFLTLLGCGSSEFDEGAAKGQLEGAPQKLSSEQVTLSDGQVDCGAKNDLWSPPSGNMAHLEQKGRDLGFSDDVRLNDPDIHVPYIQVSGTFPVSVAEVSKLRSDGEKVKLAETKTGIVIANDCFAGPLPLMGVRKGKFIPGAPVVFRFQGSGKEWSLDKLVH
jgi:hypothetical protein